ncbi:MAG: hypothetical protein BGN86_04100 [Caulobacterales bacterium 68-7]|nr:MAG: hypothetical protein BGN86_04100 [Caulobacterales bacterium 68-7]
MKLAQSGGRREGVQRERYIALLAEKAMNKREGGRAQPADGSRERPGLAPLRELDEDELT